MRITISGLINVETTVKVQGFPIPYYPIDYPFFGVNSAVSGVAYNIARALTVLGDTASLHTMVGDDFQAEFIHSQLQKCGVATDGIRAKLRQTPSSVILYEDGGRRQVYCDLKDIQEMEYGFDRLAVLIRIWWWLVISISTVLSCMRQRLPARRSPPMSMC